MLVAHRRILLEMCFVYQSVTFSFSILNKFKLTLNPNITYLNLEPAREHEGWRSSVEEPDDDDNGRRSLFMRCVNKKVPPVRIHMLNWFVYESQTFQLARSEAEERVFRALQKLSFPPPRSCFLSKQFWTLSKFVRLSVRGKATKRSWPFCPPLQSHPFPLRVQEFFWMNRFWVWPLAFGGALIMYNGQMVHPPSQIFLR